MIDKKIEKLDMPRTRNVRYVHKKKEYPWMYNDVFCDQRPEAFKWPPEDTSGLMWVYTKDEIDELVFDKFSKLIPIKHGTICLADDQNPADSFDSGITPDELAYDVINGGEF